MLFYQYQKALEYAKIALWQVIMPDGDITLTDSIKAFLGYDTTDFKKYYDFFALIHSDDKPSAFKIIEDNLIGYTQKHECEYRLKHRNGHYL